MSVSRRRFLLSCAALLAGCRGARRTTSPPPTPASPATSSTVGPQIGTGSGPPASMGESGSAAVRPLDVPPDPGLVRDPFRLGVASGDPLVDRVVLWTRLAPDADAARSAEPAAVRGMPDQPVPLLWEMTDDRGDFQRLVATGIAVAEPGEAHSVHIDVTGLPAERWFRYRFRIGPWTSPVGRTRTAPAANAVAPALTMAVGSCQNWQSGYYSAYPYLVADQPDLVAWCGDYIYEGGSDGEGPRQHDGPAAVTLDDYRNRYALYRSDPGLQAAHAACPWVVTWDDHEVVDNYAATVDSDGRGGDDFQNRRAAAYRAWWEHMPVRLPAPSGPALAVHREVRWGKLATLLVLDGRQHRTPQPCGGGLADLCQGRDAEDATMLGADQEAWLADRFAASAAAGVVWTTLVNQVTMADFVVPTGRGGGGQANMDAWDGYPAARRRLLQAASAAPVANLVVLTGDLHASMVNDLLLDGRNVGTEFVGPAIASAFPASRVNAFSLAPLLLPQIRLADARYRGYLRCQVTPGRWLTEFRWVRSVSQPSSELVMPAPRYALTAGRPGAAPV